jgi:hypothetical protein
MDPAGVGRAPPMVGAAADQTKSPTRPFEATESAKVDPFATSEDPGVTGCNGGGYSGWYALLK